MKNILTGWLTSIIGLVLIIFACLDFFGILSIPAPEGVTKMHQVTIAFIVGLILFLVPKTTIETALGKILSKKTDSI